MNTDVADRDAQIKALEADVADKAAQIETLEAEKAECEFQLTEIRKLFITTFANAPANEADRLQDSENAGVIKRFRIRDLDNPNARKIPSMTRGAVMGHAKKSLEYTILEVSPNGWYKIRLDSGKTAWVNGAMGSIVEVEFIFKHAEEEAAAE